MNKKGGSIILQALVSFILAIFLFAFSLPLMREIFASVTLGTVESFIIYGIPFVILFLLLWAFIGLLGGGNQ